MNFKNDVLFYLSNMNNIREEDEEGGEAEASCKASKKKVLCPKCGKEKCECCCKTSVTTKTTGGDDGDDAYGKASVPTDYVTGKPLEKNKGLKGNGLPVEKKMLDQAVTNDKAISDEFARTRSKDEKKAKDIILSRINKKASIKTDMVEKAKQEAKKHSTDIDDVKKADEEAKKNKQYIADDMGDTEEEKEMLDKVGYKKSSMKASMNALAGNFNKVTRNKDCEKDMPELPDDHTNGRNSSCKTKNPLKESILKSSNIIE